MAYSIENNKPTVGSIRWTGLNMTYKGETYPIQDGYTNSVYAYWTPSYPNNLVVTNTFPTLGDNDCLIFLNKNGIATTVPKTQVIDGDLIVPGSILANAIAANTITGDKIMAGAISASKIAANAIGADKIAAGAVVADKIATGAITTAHLSAAGISADKITSGTISADRIATNISTVNKTLTLGSAGEAMADIYFKCGGKISVVQGSVAGAITVSAESFKCDDGTAILNWKMKKLPTDISTFYNSWSSHATYKARYAKTLEGVVILNGLLSNSGTPVAGNIALLPSGYRPAVDTIFYVPNYLGGGCRITIKTTGYIYFDNIGAGFNSYLCLNGIAFVEAGASDAGQN